MYIYHALINALSAHMTHINLNNYDILYTRRAQSHQNNPHKAPYGKTNNTPLPAPHSPHEAEEERKQERRKLNGMRKACEQRMRIWSDLIYIYISTTTTTKYNEIFLKGNNKWTKF